MFSIEDISLHLLWAPLNSEECSVRSHTLLYAICFNEQKLNGFKMWSDNNICHGVMDLAHSLNNRFLKIVWPFLLCEILQH